MFMQEAFACPSGKTEPYTIIMQTQINNSWDPQSWSQQLLSVAGGSRESRDL